MWVVCVPFVKVKRDHLSRQNGAAPCLHNVDQRKFSVECGKMKSGSIFHFMPFISNTYYCTQTTTQHKRRRRNYYSVKASWQTHDRFSAILHNNTLFVQLIFDFCYINKPDLRSSSLHQSLCCSTRRHALVRNSTTLQANTRAQIKHWFSWFQGILPRVPVSSRGSQIATL